MGMHAYQIAKIFEDSEHTNDKRRFLSMCVRASYVQDERYSHARSPVQPTNPKLLTFNVISNI